MTVCLGPVIASVIAAKNKLVAVFLMLYVTIHHAFITHNTDALPKWVGIHSLRTPTS